jgi:phosphatidylserine/phosphatidylglycerophosphate/cardiolipin synthase-like enzyme
MRSLFTKSAGILSNDIHMYNQESFYTAFGKDLLLARDEVVIESPFITVKRINELLPILTRLRKRGVAITVNTRDPIEHDSEYEAQAIDSIAKLQSLGVKVLYTVKHHRKLAVIDKSMVWNGSLNILSQNDSCEIMWRVNSPELASKLLEFINVKRYTRR